jgi:type II secretory pathway component GspD/PulD (secretin)
MRTKATALLLVQLCLFAAVPALSQPQIPWDTSLTVTRTSSEEDIKDVLRGFLQANGFSVVFGPNVAGNVSFRLERVPLAVAFDQIIDENNLSYDYNATTHTVAITGRGGMMDAPRVQTGTFVPLDMVDYDELTRAIASFGLSNRGLRYDESSRTVSIAGDAQHVQEITDLIKALEASHQRETARANTERTRMLEQQRTALAQRVYEEARNFQVKVIPLRFTDVGPTTKQFQGRSVTIPGIADTLTTILGLNDANKNDTGVPLAPLPPPPGSPIPPGASAMAGATTFLGEAQLAAGKPRISIDQRTNSVVVQGSPEAIAAVEKIIHELDRPLQMVQIEVVIANADLGVARELGVQWRGSILNRGTPASGAIDTGTGGGQIDNNATGNGFNTTGLDALSLLPIPEVSGTTAASFVVKGAEGALQAQLQALASKDRARILSAPRLVTLDNITARITRSQNIFVQVDTRGPTGGGLGGVGLQEIQTGLTLEITPSIVPAESDNNASLVRLNLRAENSSPGAGVFGQIDVKSQEVQTNVLVPDGATFVIGGLFDDSQILSETGIPGLKDIPLIGNLFKDTKSTKSLGETIFFITPHVVDERTVLQDDIAVKVGSEEYIRRQRRALETEVHDPINKSVAPRPGYYEPADRIIPRNTSPLSSLKEDE